MAPNRRHYSSLFNYSPLRQNDPIMPTNTGIGPSGQQQPMGVVDPRLAEAYQRAGIQPKDISGSEMDALNNKNPFATVFDKTLIPLDENKIYAPDEFGQMMAYNTGNNITYDQYRLIPTTWTEEMKQNFVREGILRGIPGFNANMGMPEILSAWDDFTKVAMAMNQNQGTPQNPTPIHNAVTVMRSYNAAQKGSLGTRISGDWEIDIATGEKVRYIGPKEITTTRFDVDLSSKDEARYIVTNALSQLLGRDPNAREINTFFGALTRAETESPVETKTTVYLDDMGQERDRVSMSRGGLTDAVRMQMAQDQARQNPEYGAYQASTTYMDILRKMVFGG